MADEDILPLLGINVDDNDDVESESESNSAGSELEEEDEQNGEAVDREKDKKKKKKDKVQPSRSVSFDSTLPSSHSYLGTDLEEIRGRKIMDEDMEVSLPLVTLPGTILVPGHIIPLYSHHPQEVAMLKNVVDSQDKTFGVVALRYTGTGHSIANIGTTAEIYSVKNELDEASGISTITVLAQGRQRFQLIDYKRTITGTQQAKVKILPDIVMDDILHTVRPTIHCKLCCQEEREEDTKVAVDRHGHVLSSVQMRPRPQITRFSAAHYTWWPPWVYKMYDSELLVTRIKAELQKWNESLIGERMPCDPTKLSYWLTQNLPLDDTTKLHLLSINTAQRRLRCALSIVVKGGDAAVLITSSESSHFLPTRLKKNILDQTSYAWTIAQCDQCSSHMGWKFTTKRKDLMPQKFWGLCRSSLLPGMINPGEGENDPTNIIM